MPGTGVRIPAWQKLLRLVGIDDTHVNGLENKFWEPDDSVVRSIQACLTPLLGGYPIMPVISSGQWGGRRLKPIASPIPSISCTGGRRHHGSPRWPRGRTAGPPATWDAALLGVTVEADASDHPEPRQSIAKFGSRSAASKKA